MCFLPFRWHAHYPLGNLRHRWFSKGDPWINNISTTWELKNAILQPHPELLTLRLRVGPAICVLTSTPPPGDVLKIENGCQRTWCTPESSPPLPRSLGLRPSPQPWLSPASLQDHSSFPFSHWDMRNSADPPVFPAAGIAFIGTISFPLYYSFPIFQALSWLNSEEEMGQILFHKN